MVGVGVPRPSGMLIVATPIFPHKESQKFKIKKQVCAPNLARKFAKSQYFSQLFDRDHKIIVFKKSYQIAQIRSKKTLKSTKRVISQFV